MNERLQQLASKAGFAVGKRCVTPSYDVYELEEIEKFAQLIVRDCASICELNGQSYKHSFTPAKARLAESTSNHCGLMIKKHFGVE